MKVIETSTSFYRNAELGGLIGKLEMVCWIGCSNQLCKERLKQST